MKIIEKINEKKNEKINSNDKVIENEKPKTILTENVALELAKKDKLPKEILEELSESKNNRVLRYLAINKNTDADILDKISKINDIKVKMCVAENSNTSEKTLIEMYEDAKEKKEVFVLGALSSNENTPKNILKEMESIENTYIQ